MPNSVASARVLEKPGMKLEGRLCDKEHFRGRCADMMLCATLEHEWHVQGSKAKR